MPSNDQDPNRRDFLRTTAFAASTFAVAAQPTDTAGWFDRPMRWAQLTLVENDPGTYDLNFWLDYFRRTHSDAVCLSAGGCVAYYPTKVPLHYRSQWLANTDPFGDLVAGCRKLRMVVIARTDPHAAHNDVADAHPDWIAVDAEGKMRRHPVMPELWVTCALGPYNFEFMTEVTKEIVSSYQVDGVFSNRWTGSGMCYCEHCRQNFQSATGMDLPRTTDPRDPRRRAHIAWRQQRLFDLWRLWDAEIRAINPAACYIPNSGGGALADLDMKTIGERAPILFADRQGRSGVAAPWASGKSGKEFRSTMGRKPIGGIFSVGFEEPYRWKDSVQSGAEVRLWALDGVANGLRPWFTKFSATLYDRRWLPVVEDLYGWLHRNERYLRNEQPLAVVVADGSGAITVWNPAECFDKVLETNGCLRSAIHHLLARAGVLCTGWVSAAPSFNRTFFSRSLAICSGLCPNPANTSPVCSPSSGELVISGVKSENLIGPPTVR